MADIFISYSSKDRKQAMALVKRLQGSGFHVWIDKKDIGGAVQWSGEIVEAIEHCQIVIVLISHAGLRSDNVIKEISLASAKHKKIVPITLEHIDLTNEFQYHLAGIQHIAYKEYDRIEKALHRILSPGQNIILQSISRINHRRGIALTSIAAIVLLVLGYIFFVPTNKSARQADSSLHSGEILHLAVLHINNRSPTAENSWLTDGIVDWLTTTLGSLERLYVIPRAEVLYHDTVGITTVELATELNVQYVITGSIRDSANRVSIALTLLDINNETPLWSKRYDGAFKEIFSIQQRSIRSIVGALQLPLSARDEKILTRKETDSPEAYQLYLRGLAHYRKHTRADYIRSIELREEALKYDPRFVLAHLGIANTCQEYYYRFEQNGRLLKQAEQHLSVAASIEGETPRIYQLRNIIALRSGDPQQQLQLAQ